MITQTTEEKHLDWLGVSNRLSDVQEKIIRVERIVDIQFHRAVAALARRRSETRQANCEISQNKLNSTNIVSVDSLQPEPEFVPSQACDAP